MALMVRCRRPRRGLAYRACRFWEAAASLSDPSRILVSLPNWVGDVVMATAALRAIRRRFPDAHVAHLMRPYVADVLRGTCFSDEQVFWPASGGLRSLLKLAGDLRRRRFDLGVLLTNSFKSALVFRLAGVDRRAGYSRDGRGWLLTDRLHAPKQNGRYVPIPALDYYNDLAVRIGCEPPGDRMELAATPEDETAIEKRLGADDMSRPLIALNPGANYGSAKCWPPEKYAALSDALVQQYGARVVASLGPKEKRIANELAAAAKEPIDIYVDPPLGLGPLKALVKRCDLLITNDTGPRHFAAAFDTPVVTIYGSSDPAWTITRFEKEREVMLDLDCQPCMERVCPLKHHDCMRKLEPELVLKAVEQLLAPPKAANNQDRATVAKENGEQ